MKADAKVWRRHESALERGGNHDALSSLQAQKIEPHAQPPSPPKPRAPRPQREAQGRQISAAREGAIAAGDNTYNRHSPCKRCGGYLYYVMGQNCVTCAKVAARKAEAKKRAAAKSRTSKANGPAAKRGRSKSVDVASIAPSNTREVHSHAALR